MVVTPGGNASGALLSTVLIPPSSVAIAFPKSILVRKSSASTINESGTVITGLVVS